MKNLFLLAIVGGILWSLSRAKAAVGGVVSQGSVLSVSAGQQGMAFLGQLSKVPGATVTVVMVAAGKTLLNGAPVNWDYRTTFEIVKDANTIVDSWFQLYSNIPAFTNQTFSRAFMVPSTPGQKYKVRVGVWAAQSDGAGKPTQNFTVLAAKELVDAFIVESNVVFEGSVSSVTVQQKGHERTYIRGHFRGGNSGDFARILMGRR